MKKINILFFFILMVFFFQSCSTSYKIYENFTVSNRNNLALLESGMSKLEVSNIMGKNSVKSSGAYIGNPFKTEAFKTTDGQSISIFWYYTQIRSSNARVDDDELTPVVFKNGKMEGYGWSFYRDTHQHIDINNKTQITID